MSEARLSSKGQVVIPKAVRDSLALEPGTTFDVMVKDNAVVLTLQQPFKPTTIDEAYGCLPYSGPSESVEEMTTAARRGVAARFRRSMP